MHVESEQQFSYQKRFRSKIDKEFVGFRNHEPPTSNHAQILTFEARKGKTRQGVHRKERKEILEKEKQGKGYREGKARKRVQGKERDTGKGKGYRERKGKALGEMRDER